jgi:hypothetical protein
MTLMKRLFTATCVAAACMVGLAAQSGSSSSSQDPNQTSGRGGRTQTVTGCLRAGDTAGTYVLTNVTGLQMGRRGGGDTGMGSGGAGEPAGGAAGMGQGGGRGMTLTLSAGSDVDLSAHVGHKVEVMGTLAGGRRSGGGGDTGMGSGGGGDTGMASGGGMGGGQGMGRGMMRTLNVTSVKMISSDCGAAQ